MVKTYSKRSNVALNFSQLENGPMVSVIGCGKQSEVWYVTIP